MIDDQFRAGVNVRKLGSTIAALVSLLHYVIIPIR
jgi:hypothetical protein